jgi:hypothetical protein
MLTERGPILSQGPAGNNQADRRFRPLARRALMIALPLLVAIRDRKPCLRARFSRLGWKVRFIFLILSKIGFHFSQSRYVKQQMADKRGEL